MTRRPSLSLIHYQTKCDLFLTYDHNDCRGGISSLSLSALHLWYRKVILDLRQCRNIYFGGSESAYHPSFEIAVEAFP